MIYPKTSDKEFFSTSASRMFVSNKDFVVYDMLVFTSTSNASANCEGSSISMVKSSGTGFNLQSTAFSQASVFLKVIFIKSLSPNEMYSGFVNSNFTTKLVC